MTEIRFYHLQTQSLDEALPTLVAKAYESGKRILIRAHAAELDRLSNALWTYRPDSFLPHGVAAIAIATELSPSQETTKSKDKAEKTSANPADHPIWLVAANENSNDTELATPPPPAVFTAPNNADMLVVSDGATLKTEALQGFTLCCDMFDGRDEAQLNAARSRWKTYQDKGLALTYWQQTPQGSWTKKN